LVELGRRSGVPVYEDLGSGCLADLSPFGVSEPVVSASTKAGADIVSFSGDKLLGGPQAGIIAGHGELIARVRKHPLFRALRADKLVIAALEATLIAYLEGDLDAVPALRMIRLPAAEIERRARSLADSLRALLPPGEVQFELVSGESVIGGGSTPDQPLPTFLLRLSGARWSAAELDERLRRPASGPAVLARIAQDRLVIDLRTVFPEQEPALAAALAAAFR
jgi:L-seryl-tRNA(Ser) seleniumtransferase